MRTPARALVTLTLALGAVGAPALGEGPLGSHGSWAPLLPSGARWNPCAPVRYALHDSVPDDAVADVREALWRVGEASGLVFRYQGRTSALPAVATPEPAAGHDVVVAFVPHGHPSWQGRTADGYAHVTAVPGHRPGGRRAARLHAGYVLVDPASTAEPGFVSERGRVTRGQVLMHEAAHVAGLGHVEDPTQIMNPVSLPHDSAWGAGDLAGLAALGAGKGCLYGSAAEARAHRGAVLPQPRSPYVD